MSHITLEPDGSRPPTETEKASIRAALGVNDEAGMIPDAQLPDQFRRWAVMSDWHYTEQFGRGGNQRTRDGFQEIGRYHPSLGVSCGDLTCQHGDDPMIDYDYFKQIRAYSACPWIHCVGNHEISLTTNDTRTYEEKVASSQAFYQGVADDYVMNEHEFLGLPRTDPDSPTSPVDPNYLKPLYPPSHYGQLVYPPGTLPIAEQAQTLGYFAMDHIPTGVTHVVLNSAFYPTNGKGQFGTDQKTWITAVLAKIHEVHGDSARIAVYLHAPARYTVNGATYLTATDRDWLHAALLAFQGKVLIVCSGHIHGDYFVELDGINYLTLDNGGNASVGYHRYGSDLQAFYLMRWDEDSSQLHIDAKNGGVSRVLTIL